jgi:hypothetical protein
MGGWVNLTNGLDDLAWTKIFPLPGHALRHVGRPVRSQSLYQLHYPQFEKSLKRISIDSACARKQLSEMSRVTAGVNLRNLTEHPRGGHERSAIVKVALGQFSPNFKAMPSAKGPINFV